MSIITAKVWRKMVNASDTLEQARPFAAALVEREQQQAGSRMAAYERVATRIGVSPSWLRKLVGRQPEVKEMAAQEYLNIVAAYRSLCERIEAEAERERARAAALRRKLDATLDSDPILVARVARPQGGGEDSEEV